MSESLGSFTFSFIKPHAIRAGRRDAIAEIIDESGFAVAYKKIQVIRGDQIRRIYPHTLELLGEEKFVRCDTYISNTMSESEGMLLWSESDNAAQMLRMVIGRVALSGHPGYGIRGRFSESQFLNAIHGSDTEAFALKELEIYDPDAIPSVLQDELYGQRLSVALERNQGGQ